MVDWGTTALYVALALTVIGWFYVDVRERKLARDSAVHQQKVVLFQNLDAVVRKLADAVSTLEFVRTLDFDNKEERASSFIKLTSIPFRLGSRDAVYNVLDELDEYEEPKNEKQTKERIEGLKGTMVLETWIVITELSNTLQDVVFRLEYVEYGPAVRSGIQRLLSELAELQSSSGAAYWYEAIGLKGFVQPPSLENWAPKIGKSIEELKEAMKLDLARTL